MKKVHIKSAIPIYIAGAVWLAMGLVFPKFLLGLPGLLVTAALSAGAGWVSTRFFPGRDMLVEEKITTGDVELDREIAQGRARLESLRQANAAINDPGISRCLERMNVAGEQIFKELGREPKKKNVVHRFMSYYLPTAEKLMQQYQVLMGTATRGDNIQSAMKRIENSMDMIASAFEKCADNLFADREMDIDAEIKVLRTLLAGDSLINDAAQASQASSQTQSEEGEGIRLTLGGH